MKYLYLLVLFFIYYIFVFVGAYFLLQQQKEHLVVKFLDVGQGDSILIRNPEGEYMLIDGGPDNTVDYKIFREFFPFACDLKYIVLTHPHKDHVAGLLRVLDRCNVEKILYPSVENFESSYFTAFMARTKHIDYEERNNFKFGSVQVTVLNRPALTKSKNPNNLSLILLLDYFDVEVLLTGDAESEVLSSLDVSYLLSTIEGSLDVYKAPHQGALDGLYAPLVQSLQPETVVISVGKNSYGHPHPAALSFYTGVSGQVFRTDVMGDIIWSK